MTDLLNRPSEKTETREDPGPRPLAVGAALAAAAASLGTLLTCMAVCVVGWFLADAGAHGQTTDALRVGADMWLLGHGSGLDVAGTPVHVVPLALTALLALAAWRLGRWAAATSAPAEDDRSAALAGIVFCGVYLVVTVVVCIVAAGSAATRVWVAPSSARSWSRRSVRSGWRRAPAGSAAGSTGCPAGSARSGTAPPPASCCSPPPRPSSSWCGS